MNVHSDFRPKNNANRMDRKQEIGEKSGNATQLGKVREFFFGAGLYIKIGSTTGQLIRIVPTR